jgi:2,3-bisphosphoglycerate-dependent phosphoglycerate mutase
LFTLQVPIIVHNESEQATLWSGVYSEKTTKQSIPVITTWQLNERMYVLVHSMFNEFLKDRMSFSILLLQVWGLTRS